MSCCLLLACFSLIFSVCKENLLSSFFLFITLMGHLFYSGLGFHRPCADVLHVGLSGLWALKKIYVGLIYFDLRLIDRE